MKQVTREEYSTFLKTYPELVDKPVVTTSRAVMQHVDRDGSLKAQAIYVSGLAPRYEVAEHLEAVMNIDNWLYFREMVNMWQGGSWMRDHFHNYRFST